MNVLVLSNIQHLIQSSQYRKLTTPNTPSWNEPWIVLDLNFSVHSVHPFSVLAEVGTGKVVTKDEETEIFLMYYKNYPFPSVSNFSSMVLEYPLVSDMKDAK